MSIDRAVLAFAGAMILVSLLLGIYVSVNWFWLTGFVGANLLQFGFTKVCPLGLILKKLGVKESCAGA